MEIIHDIQNHQFILPIDDKLKAIVIYSLDDNNHMKLIHSEVPAELRGTGMGRELVLKTFEKLTEEGYEATAICGYIRAIASRHPKWSEIIK